MEGIKDNTDSDSDLDPENDPGIAKKFLIEMPGKFKSTSTVELSNYEEALELFNQRSKEGKNLILYEIHKSLNDGSIVKKVPVLNTSKHAQRMRALQDELKEATPANNGTLNAPASTSSSPSSSTPNQKGKVTLASMKYKILILAAVVAGFIILLFILDIIAGGGSGNMSCHMTALEAVLKDVHDTTINIESNYNNHPDLFSI